MRRRENLSSASFNAIKTQAVFSDIYNFFDVTIAMKSDEKELLDRVRQLYPRFRMEQVGKKVDATCYLVKASEKPLVIMEKRFSRPFLVHQENSHLKIKSLDDIDSVPAYACLLAFNHIAANLKSHFLLRGAVVSRNGDGLAIVGSPGLGKTALMLELLLRGGFRFLSDSILAINRTTHEIDPYPVSIGITENTLALLDSLELGHLEPQVVIGGQRKWFVDISEISENAIGKPCRPKYLIFLVNSLNETERDEQHVELAVDDVNDELLEKFQLLARNGEVHCRRMRNCYALSFYPTGEAPSALEIERICCDSGGVWLLDVRKLSDVKPDFHLTPGIQRVPWHVATMELLKELRNDFRSAPAQAFLELAGLLQGVECYKLSIGKLGEMAEHVCNLTRSREMQDDHTICYEDGEVIFEEDSIGKEIYTIVSGKVEIKLPIWSGKETCIAVLTKGDFFGAMAGLTNARSSAMAKAIGRTTLMSFSLEEMLQRMQANPQFAVNVLQTLTRHMRHTTFILRTLIVRMYAAGMEDIFPEERPLKIGEILMERGCLTGSQLKRFLQKQKEINMPEHKHKLLGEIITGSSIVTEEELGSALAEQQIRLSS